MMRIRRPSRCGGKQKDSGYALLLLMLAVALLMITMLGVAHNYKREIQRDREVEMIHRGEQYERAVRRFYIKNSRYPVSIEQLENMNKIRYLRKRYKDPMSPDGEWKLVHPTDFNMTGAVTQPTTGTAAGSSPSTPLQPAAQDAGGSATGVSPAAAPTGTVAGPTSGTDTGNSSGGSTSGNGSSAFGNSSSGSTGGVGSTQGSSAFGTPAGAGNNATNGQVLGGGDIYGVVSKSKQKGFHIFGEKEKYNEWFFVYVPAMDKGQLLVGPYNPKMFIGSANSGLNSGKSTSSTGTGIGGSQGTGSTSGGSSFGSPTPSPSPTTPSQPNQ